MFKKFVSYYRKHLGLFLIDMAAALIMAGIDLIYPSFTRTFMNDYNICCLILFTFGGVHLIDLFMGLLI